MPEDNHAAVFNVQIIRRCRFRQTSVCWFGAAIYWFMSLLRAPSSRLEFVNISHHDRIVVVGDDGAFCLAKQQAELLVLCYLALSCYAILGSRHPTKSAHRDKPTIMQLIGLLLLGNLQVRLLQ